MDRLTQAEFLKRTHKQNRAIKKYAKSLSLDIETAYMKWVENGLAKAWATQN